MSDEDIERVVHSVISATPSSAPHGFLGVPPVAHQPSLITHDWSPPPMPVGATPASFHPLVSASALVVRSMSITDIDDVIQRVVTP